MHFPVNVTGADLSASLSVFAFAASGFASQRAFSLALMGWMRGTVWLLLGRPAGNVVALFVAGFAACAGVMQVTNVNAALG